MVESFPPAETSEGLLVKGAGIGSRGGGVYENNDEPFWQSHSNHSYRKR